MTEQQTAAQDARIAELEAQLEAIGAGGVSGPLMGRAMDHFRDATKMMGRWYVVTNDGVATLCEDRADAEKEAKDADMAWPHSGPHRAVQLVEAAPKTAPGDALDEAMRERDDAEDFINELLDEVLGADRPEWSSAYNRYNAMDDVRERITALHKPAVDKAWGQFESAMEAPQQPAPSAAAHVGDSLFESWFSEYNPAHRGTKQQMRDAYAAGMGDPKAQPSPTPHTTVPTTTARHCAQPSTQPWPPMEETSDERTNTNLP